MCVCMPIFDMNLWLNWPRHIQRNIINIITNHYRCRLHIVLGVCMFRWNFIFGLNKLSAIDDDDDGNGRIRHFLWAISWYSSMRQDSSFSAYGNCFVSFREWKMFCLKTMAVHHAASGYRRSTLGGITILFTQIYYLDVNNVTLVPAGDVKWIWMSPRRGVVNVILAWTCSR